jgi:preprotein translocase subunit SecG
MRVLIFLLSMIYVIACLFLIFVVLIQKGEGGGLGGLVGGGAVDTAFGAKADMTWKRATAVSAGIFVGLALLLGIMQRPHSATEFVASPSPKAPKITVSPPAPPAPNPNPPAAVGTTGK